MIMSPENASVLRGLMCPSCSSKQPLCIDGSSTFTMYDDGSATYGAVVWNMDSRCTCGSCNHSATIREFREAIRLLHDRRHMVGDALNRVNRLSNVQRNTTASRT